LYHNSRPGQSISGRPLSLILDACFAAGLILDGLEEPVFSEGAEAQRPFSWENSREIPPVLVARLIPKP